jgi:hypothetical protein
MAFAVMLVTGCPSVPPPPPTVPSQPRPHPTSSIPTHVDAVRIQPAAAASFLSVANGELQLDGETLHGIVDDVRIIVDDENAPVDTLWTFRHVRVNNRISDPIAIPIRDIVLLPSLYRSMVTDENRGINLVESFHVSKQIPEIRKVPVLRVPCASPLRPRAVFEPPPPPPCACEPFVIDLDMDVACANRAYKAFTISALVRGSAYTDGVEPIAAGRTGLGLDVVSGYRFGPSWRWMVGVTVSTGITTVNMGEFQPTVTNLAQLAELWRPLALATARYYLVGFDSPPSLTKDTEKKTRPDTVLRYANGTPVVCPPKPKIDSVQKRPDSTGVVQPDTSSAPFGGSLCEEEVREVVVRAQQRYDSLVRATIVQYHDEPVRQFLGGCIKPYVYGELGTALDLRTRGGWSMALNMQCDDCTPMIRDANADGSLGLNWSLPLTFGFGVGLDVPVHRLFDIEVDLGFRSISVGDSYRVLGFANVPSMRRIGTVQLRVGVMW